MRIVGFLREKFLQILKFVAICKSALLKVWGCMSFGGTSERSVKVYYAKIFFSTYSEKFLALYDICFCPQHLSIPLLHKALFLEDCWLLFTFCSVQTNLFT